jgi:hypothetical protein
LWIMMAWCLAGCTGYHGPAAATAAVPTSGYSNAAATGTLNSSTGSGLPGDLTGLDSSALHSLFGTPELVRKDYPAEVWQYRSPNCVLDVYLYPDHDRLTVAHAEARAPKATGDPLAGCIAKFAQVRAKTVG